MQAGLPPFMTKSINPLEIQAVRRILFLSVEEAAVVIGHCSPQTWASWETGSCQISEAALRTLSELLDWRTNQLAYARARLINEPRGTAFVLWYDTMDNWLTLDDHSPRLWRAEQSLQAALLAEFPERVSLVKFDSLRYANWLGARMDSAEARARWVEDVVSQDVQPDDDHAP